MSNIKNKINIERLSRSKWVYILASIVFVILGLMLIFDPVGTARKLAFLFGGALIAYGAFRLASYFIKNKGEKNVSMDIIIGTVLCIGGLAIIIYHNEVAGILSFILGGLLIVDGMLKLQTAINAKRTQVSSWWVVLVSSLVCIAFGCALIFVPALRVNAPYIALGIAFLAEGIQNLISAIYSGIIEKKAPASDRIDLEKIKPQQPPKELNP